MSNKHSDIIFCASSHGPEGALSELVVSEDFTVYFTHRKPGGGRVQTEEVDRRRKDVDAFLWEIEDILINDWDQRRYEGDEQPPTSWMVLLEKDRRLQKWEGSGAYPPRWQEFRLLIEQLIDHAFAW
jgi:hypothetical protein